MTILPGLMLGLVLPESSFLILDNSDIADFQPYYIFLFYLIKYKLNSTEIFFKIYLFIYLFLAVLGLRFCARAFSSCGKRGPLFIVVCGPLTLVASLVAEHRLQTRRLSSCGSRA